MRNETRMATGIGPLLAAAVMALLAGCSGGGGGAGVADQSGGAPPAEPEEHRVGDGGAGAPDSEKPGGIYSGVVYSTLTNRSDDVIALVTESGDARVYDVRDGSLYVMQVNPMPQEFTTTVRYIPGGGALASSGTAQGVVAQRDLIGASFTLANGATGTIDLAYEGAAYERASSLAALAGNWSYGDRASYAFDLAIDGAGAMHGQDSRNCTLEGTVRTIDAAFNLYSMSVVESCGTAATASYTGLATVIPATDTVPEGLMYVMSSTSAGYRALLRR